MSTPAEVAAAESFLDSKVRQLIGQSNIPALSCVLVRDAGETIVTSQQGIRKVGASGPQNTVTSTDRFNIGSLSKVFTAHLIGVMIDADTMIDTNTKLSWTSSLQDVMPELASTPNPHSTTPGATNPYMPVTIDEYTVHVSGMPWTPNPQREPLEEWKTTTPAEWTDNGEISLKYTYVTNALMDEPVSWPLGTEQLYSGGQVINAAMLERLTKVPFEDLIVDRLFAPLGMVNTSFGRTAWNLDGVDGPWFHAWDPSTMTLVPHAEYLLGSTNAEQPNGAFDGSPRNPVGGQCTTADDLSKFLVECVSPHPKLFHPDTLKSMQTYVP